MVEKFINPNWHVVLIHYPLGLLTVGVVIELLNLICPRDRFRSAGRWMITLGGLGSVVALAAGIYAYRDVVSTLPADPDYHWKAIVAHSTWVQDQWDFLRDHIIYNVIATAIFLVTVALAIGGGDAWRQRWHKLLVLALVIGVVLVGIGAWHGGEMVYRFGTGVLVQAPAGPTMAAPQAKPEVGVLKGYAYYIQPLQLHAVLAGLVIALGVAATAITFRRWNSLVLLPPPAGARVQASPLTTEPIMQRVPGEQPVKEPPHYFPGSYWLIALLTALGTALAGAWSVMEVFTGTAWQENVNMLRESSHLRLQLHVVFGVALILSFVLLAIFVRLAPQWFKVIKVFIVIALVMMALQVGLGSLMLFDSHEGPLFGFSSADGVEPKSPTTIQERPAREQGPATLPAMPTTRP